MSSVLPGVTVEVSAVDLAIATPIGLNVLAVVGTAKKGPIDTPTMVSNVQKAYDLFGYPDEYDITAEGQELTLTRGIQLAFDAGASRVFAVRVASSSAEYATRYLDSTTNYCAKLIAATKGTWGNDLFFKVEIADGVTATEGHVAAHFGFVEDYYSDAWTLGSPFDYLEIATALNYPAEAGMGNSIRIVHAAGAGVSTLMAIIHSDAHLFKESGDVDATAEIMSGNTDKFAQTFTTIDACKLENIKIRMKYATANPVIGSCVVSIFAVDSDGKPTGSTLGDSTVLWTTLALTTNYTTEDFAFSPSIDLVADTMYAIVVSSTGGWTATAEMLLGGFTAIATDTFTKGKAWFDAAGAGFVVSAEIADWMFETEIEIAEAHCEFVINNWGSSYPSANLKYIRWSTTSTPTDTTEAYVNYFTAHSRKVSIKFGDYIEQFWVVDGNDLINDVNDDSSLVTGAVPEAGAGSSPTEEPTITQGWQQFGQGLSGYTTVGADGATDVSSGDYETGLAELEKQLVHVVCCPGRFERAAITALMTHCVNASKKGTKHERIAVAGHGYGKTLDQVLQATGPYASERLVFVTPGVKRTNVYSGELEILSASYHAAYLAGWLVAGDLSESNLMKILLISGVETVYTEAEAEQIVQRRMIPATQVAEGGIKWRESLTTSTDLSWREITIVRISDYARYAIRSACSPFVGNKNLIYQRAAIKSALTRAFKIMVTRDYLDKDAKPPYTITVTSDADQKAAGIVEVNITFKPVKAIKYIIVKAFLKS